MESRCLEMRAEKAVQQLTGEECPCRLRFHPTPAYAPNSSKTQGKSQEAPPGTLTPLATFRQLHHISEKAVEIAVRRNKLAVVRGAVYGTTTGYPRDRSRRRPQITLHVSASTILNG